MVGILGAHNPICTCKDPVVGARLFVEMWESDGRTAPPTAGEIVAQMGCSGERQGYLIAAEKVFRGDMSPLPGQFRLYDQAGLWLNLLTR
jgi:hypothetical protein